MLPSHATTSDHRPALGIAVHIRWMVRRDMAEVLAIEDAAFGPHAWTAVDFIRCLRQRNCIGMSAEHGERIVGFMIYTLHKDRLDIFNFAVHPDFRRLGVGTAMLQKLAGKLGLGRRNSLTMQVRETNLDCQKFLRANGFKAVSVLRSPYDDCDEDAYLMRYRYRPSEVLA